MQFMQHISNQIWLILVFTTVNKPTYFRKLNVTGFQSMYFKHSHYDHVDPVAKARNVNPSLMLISNRWSNLLMTFNLQSQPYCLMVMSWSIRCRDIHAIRAQLPPISRYYGNWKRLQMINPINTKNWNNMGCYSEKMWIEKRPNSNVYLPSGYCLCTVSCIWQNYLFLIYILTSQWESIDVHIGFHLWRSSHTKWMPGYRLHEIS